MFAGARRRWVVLLTLVLCVSWGVRATAATAPAAPATPVQEAGYITMQDGVKLRYAVELPSATGRFPVAL